MYDTILVPTDGSDHSVRAARHGCYLARSFDATVHVLSVVDVQAAGGLFDAGGVDEAFVERLEAEGERAIDAVLSAVREEDALRTALVRGTPSEAILDYADEHGIDLVSMGTHGRTGLDRYVTGSVTERVVRHATVPVLTVRASDRSRVDGDYEDVLLPTDGSDPAAAGVDHGLAIAERTGARVHTVNVVDVTALAAGAEAAPAADLGEHLETAGERATEDVADRARDAGLEAVSAVLEGSPAEALLAYAEEHGVDLVAMGTHGRSGLDRYLLGSTTERVIRRAGAPVLAVRPPGEGANEA